MFNTSKYFLFLILIFTSSACGSIPSQPVATQTLQETGLKLPIVFQKSAMFSQFLAFLPEQSGIVVTTEKKVQAVDLTTLQITNSLSLNESSVIRAQASVRNHRFLLATSDGKIRVWNTKNWQLVHKDEGKLSPTSVGLSEDGQLLFFNGAIKSLRTGKPLIQIGYNPRIADHAISPDNHFLIEAAYERGPYVLNLKNKQAVQPKTEIQDVSTLRFIDGDRFLAAYNSKFNTELGGDVPATIGLFSAANNKRLKEFSPSARLTCWNTMSDGKIFLALSDGSWQLLDANLVTLKRWQKSGRVTHCTSQQPDQVWLGIDKQGVYRLDTESNTLAHPIRLDTSLNQLVISDDGRFLAVDAAINGTDSVQVYRLR